MIKNYCKLLIYTTSCRYAILDHGVFNLEQMSNHACSKIT